MVKHMIVWKLKEDLEDKAGRALQIKEALEGLEGKIDGLVSMKILIESLPASSGDLMMDSTFESVAALEAYQKHPLHVAVADGIVRPTVCQRLSFDYLA